MSKSGVLIWLVIALVLGAGALWVLRKPPAAPTGGKGPVVTAPMARIAELTVTTAGRPAQNVLRDTASGDWFLSGPDQGSAWPLQISNMQAALRLLCTLEGRDAGASSKAPGPGDPEVRLTLDDGTAWTLWLAPRSLGGERLAHIQPPAGGAARTVLVDGALFDALLESGPAAWRVPIAFSDLATEADEIALTAVKGRVILGRAGGRWGLQDPVAAPADEKAVQTLLKNLAGVRIARFLDAPPDPAAARLDSPIATARLVSERRVPRSDGAGEGFDTITTTRTLTVGGPASIDGKELYAQVERSTARNGQPASRASSTPVTISRESVEVISMDPVSYLTPAAVSSPAGEIGSISISGKGVSLGFTRTVDGWEPESPPGTPGDKERISALLKLLCEQAAESRLLEPQPLAAPVVLTMGSLGGTPLGAVTIGLIPAAAGPDGTPGPEKLVINSGAVARLYDLAPWREIMDWITPPPAR